MSMEKKFPVFIAVIFSTLLQSAAIAGNPGYTPTEKKIVAIVESAYDYISKHSDNMKDVQEKLQKDSRFRDDDNHLYVFMHTYDREKKEAVCIGHGVRPELLGKNMWNLRTPNGRLLFQEEVDLIEHHDQFWLEYEWLNPYTNEIQTKRSFFKKIILKNGAKAWVGSGFWKN
jgi:signal transduction histidine kinase